MSSQAQGAVGAGNTDAIAWLAKRLKAARSDSEAHPEGHSNRAFYDGQAIAYENVLSLLEHEKPATPRTDSAEVTAGAATKWTVPRAVLVEAVAQHFHNEEHQHEGYAWVWPEYADDDGRRGNSGYVSITPPVVQLECREAAERLVRLFEGYVATPAPSSPGVPDSVREAVARLINPVAFNTGPEAFGMSGENDPAWKRTLPYAARLIALDRADEVVALLSAHPAGQSTGQGADGGRANLFEMLWRDAEDEAQRLEAGMKPSRDQIAEAFHEHRRERQPNLPPWSEVDQNSGAAKFAHTFVDRLLSIRPEEPTPDSPLKQDEGTEWVLVPTEPTEAMTEAASAECHRMAGVIDPVLHVWDAMISARPAAPEAQGAWRPISTAPRDREIMGGKWHGSTWARDVTRWDGDGWWQMREIPPTHWCEVQIPTPPASSGQGER